VALCGIEWATRWVYLRIYRDQTDTSSTDFLRRVKQAAPMKIQNVLTDNGSQFADPKSKKPNLEALRIQPRVAARL